MTQQFADYLRVRPSRLAQAGSAVAQVVGADGRQARPAGEGLEPAAAWWGGSGGRHSPVGLGQVEASGIELATGLRLCPGPQLFVLFTGRVGEDSLERPQCRQGRSGGPRPWCTPRRGVRAPSYRRSHIRSQYGHPSWPHRRGAPSPPPGSQACLPGRGRNQPRRPGTHACGSSASPWPPESPGGPGRG